jgi:predicted lactoylglutathione lyase
MNSYTTLGTNNLEQAATFYEQLLTEIGGKRVVENDRMVMWSLGREKPSVAVLKPADGNQATVGNGVMLGIGCDSHEVVNTLHAKALQLGAADEGAPGPRGDGGVFYGGYFRDLDGNKLVFFKMG